MGRGTSFEAAIFDLGGVVIRIRMEGAAEYWARHTHLDGRKILAAMEADVATKQRLERGDISSRDYYEHVLALLGVSMSFEQFDLGWNNIYCGLFPGIEELLRRLGRHLRLVVFTNTSELHARQWRVRYGGVLRYFERIFTSYELGSIKPEPAGFKAVLEYLAIPPEKVIFIDDLPENVAAAAGMGMKGIVAVSPARIAEDLRNLGVSVSL